MLINQRRIGFTLIELVVVMFIMSILLGFIIMTPKLIYNTRFTVDTYSDYTEAFKILQKAIQQDLSKDSKSIEEESEGIISINGVKYEFTREGIYRSTGNSKQKLFDSKAYYEVSSSTFRVFTDIDSNNNEIDLKFNLDYTTIQKGRK